MFILKHISNSIFHPNSNAKKCTILQTGFCYHIQTNGTTFAETTHTLFSV